MYTRVSPTVKAASSEQVPKAESKRKQGSVRSYKTTSPNQPVASSYSVPSLVQARDPDEESVISNTSKKSKQSTASEKQRAADEGYDEWLANQSYDDPKTFLKKKSPSSPPSIGGNSAKCTKRTSSARIRPKFDKVNWNGMSNTFRAFKNAVEGHLHQVGASYLVKKTFLGMYKELGMECFETDDFWTLYKVSELQAISKKCLVSLCHVLQTFST